MPDCPDGEIRDLLPDLVHERLDAEARARIDSHIGDCVDCTAEIALLKRIRASADSQRLPPVDVGRIVGALPRAGRRKQSWTRSTGLRIAAGVVVLIAGATWMQRARDGEVLPVAEPAVVAQTQSVQGSDSVRSVVSTRRTTPARTISVASAARVSLDDGFNDLSDGELQSLLAALDSFDAVTAVEPSAVEPILESERLR